MQCPEDYLTISKPLYCRSKPFKAWHLHRSLWSTLGAHLTNEWNPTILLLCDLRDVRTLVHHGDKAHLTGLS